MTAARSALLALLLVACAPTASDPEPTPAPTATPAADDDDTPAPRPDPWLVVEISAANPSELIRALRERSGYLRLVLVVPGGALQEPGGLVFQGPVNPVVQALDVDGDGRLDATADIDLPSLEPRTPLVEIALAGAEVDRGVELVPGVVGYDFLGNEIASLMGDPVVFAPESDDRPRFVRLGPLSGPGGPPPCEDGLDNDGDGWTDGQDPDCGVGRPLEEGLGTTGCNDGVDNDGDGDVDAADAECDSGRDLSERASCEDGIDDDADGWIDADDPDCADGGPERGRSGSGCNDGADNDGDGLVDKLDPDCARADASE